MKRIMLIVPLLLVAVACSKNTPSASTAPSEAATVAPAASAASTTVVVTTNPSKGKILTDAAGMTLYHFDNDTTGKSNCEATCATTWPPLKFTGTGTPTGTTGLTTITRTDGSKQVALNGEPLYTYSGDTKAGDTNGDGFAGKWHVAKAP